MILNRRIALAALVIAHPCFALEDAATFGMGGVSIARTDALTHQGNPAALAMIADRADIQLAPVGYSLQRHGAQAQSRLDALRTADTLTAMQQGLAALTGTTYARQYAAGGQLALPRMPYAFAAHAYGRFEEYGQFGSPNLVFSGGQYLADFPQEVFGIARIDSGVTLSKVYRAAPGGTHRLAVGLRPQLSMLSTYYTHAQAGGAFLQNQNDASIAHPPRTRFDKAGFNLDAGVTHEAGYDWTWGLQLRDVVPRKIPFGDSGEVYRLVPRATAGILWHPSSLHWMLDLDLNKAPGYGFVAARQDVATGLDYAWAGVVHLRAGVNANLAALAHRCGSVGLGWAGSWLTADVGYRRCADATEGAALGVALKL